jgi:hypothetical protein
MAPAASAAAAFLLADEPEEEPTQVNERPRARIRMLSISVRFSDGRSKELRVKDTERNRATLGALQRRR